MIFDLSHDLYTTSAAMERMPDVHQHALTICTPLTVPKAKHRDAIVSQKSFPHLIAFELSRCSVFEAVQFDRQLGQGTVEVQKIRCERMLAAKFESVKSPVAQRVPELSLNVRLIAS